MSRFCTFRFPPRLHCVHCYLEFSLVAGIGFWSGIWQGKNPSHLNGLKIQVQFHKLVWILDFFQFQIPNPTTILWWSQWVGWKGAKPNFPIFKCFLCHPGSSNPKKKAIFVVRGSSLIGKCQNMEIYFLGNATLKLSECPTSYTLHQPWQQPNFRE